MNEFYQKPEANQKGLWVKWSLSEHLYELSLPRGVHNLKKNLWESFIKLIWVDELNGLSQKKVYELIEIWSKNIWKTT